MIKGKYTGLRAIEENDLKQLLLWRNKPDFRRYFREYRELNYAQQLQWFSTKVNNDISTRMFAIVNLESLKLLGACGLCHIDWINRTADFSIYIGEDDLYIDEKLAPDAANLLINYAYDELGLNRLWSNIYSFDTKKIKFLKDLLFSIEGVHRQAHWAEGKWCDCFYFALLQADYINKK